MKTRYLRILTGSAFILIFLLSNVFSQADADTRISFKTGATSATVKGTVAKGGPDFYLINAKAGQKMTVKVTGKVSFGIDSPDERWTPDDGNTEWTEESLPANGDYKIRVYSAGGGQDYSLTVAIAPAKKDADASYRIGTFYDGIQMSSKESGDYGGMAVYLIHADVNDDYALVTVAEGVAKRPVLVKVKSLTGDPVTKFSFAVPNENGTRKFTGAIAAGTMTLTESGSKSILKSKCGQVFSDMSVGMESGDVGGMEVFLTESDGQWFALVTTAGGVVLPPKLVEAKVTGANFDKVEFTVPDENNTDGKLKYTGIITKNALTLDYEGEKTILRKQCNK